MKRNLELPALGNSMEEGTILRWFKQPGELFAEGEPLYEVMTDKVNMEVEAPLAGRLLEIAAGPDSVIAINELVAVIETDGEGAEAPADDSVTDEKVFASPRARRVADEYGIDLQQLAGRGTGIDGRIVEADIVAFYRAQQDERKATRVTPLAAKAAAAHGLDAAQILSERSGRITKGDVDRAVAAQSSAGAETAPAPAALSDAPEYETRLLTGMRKMAADAVSRSAQTAPHVTLVLPVAAAELVRFREAALPVIEKEYGVRVTYTDLLVKASAKALANHPLLNSSLHGNEIRIYPRAHIGVAVSLGENGLIVPVLKDVASKTLGQCSAALKDLAARAKSGALSSEEVTGGTFSITNLGAYGVSQFNPIINPPQAAILGVGAIEEKLVWRDGSARPAPFLNLCLSFDHRICDGAPAAAFLRELGQLLEAPHSIVL